MDVLDLQGWTALVTGAGQGVGREIAIQFALHNAGAVVVNDVNRDRAEAVVAEIEEAGGRAAAAVADVTDLAAVSDMVAEVNARFGSLDILVSNAGNYGADASAVTFGEFWTIDPREWQPWVGVNFYGPIMCAHAALPGMVERRRGRIITIVSDAGRVGEAGSEVYSAAKAGAAGFTRAIARSVGRYDITANNIAIAATRTPAVDEQLSDPGTLKRVMSKYVLRRPGEPSDIAPMVLLLASAGGSWITGQTYPVNGGYSFAL
ncbi:SDR family NAD(P)-dependent oxidoreductase [Amycolatopsis sp.]|jgi:3-oxoacyl-[acyl-carrier protein] reductase|uniref:SDR family NAD(P)-dependent oxidoreductase n=1 Tax=Amycolatopsis sp. TaxID=37632 RepID=UPI002DFF0934|nr:SDR family NAD(P)-dependent oxidoreductase [Amycolatopsis sp.]